MIAPPTLASALLAAALALPALPASATAERASARILDADGAAQVIHENRDDHASQAIGGAGGRFSCGVTGAQ